MHHMHVCHFPGENPQPWQKTPRPSGTAPALYSGPSLTLLRCLIKSYITDSWEAISVKAGIFSEATRRDPLALKGESETKIMRDEGEW